MANIAHVRVFNGSSDKIELDSSEFRTALTSMTVAMIVRRDTDTGWQWGWSLNDTGTGGAEIALGSNGTQMRVWTWTASVSGGSGGTTTWTAANGWHLIAATKPDGASTPRFHHYNYGTATWTHEDGTGATVDLGTPDTNSKMWIGAWDGASEWFDGRIACIGVWRGTELSDANFETMEADLASWEALSPSHVWLLNQTSTDSPVTDRIGNADQIAISGTSVAGESVLPFDVGKAGAGRRRKRLYGPGQLARAPGDLYTVPAAKRARLRHVYVSNPGSVDVDFTIALDYAAMVVADGAAGYWRLNEASGQPQDSSGNANHTTNTGGTPVYMKLGALVSDPRNTAIAFDRASNEYFVVQDHVTLDFGDVGTWETWLRRASTSGSREDCMMAKGVNSAFISIKNDRLHIAKTGVASIVESTITLTDTSAWYHCVVTKNGSTVALYVNGTDVTGTVTNQTLANTTDSLILGGDTTAPYPFDGILDEMAVYPTALSAARVLAHYQAGVGLLFDDERAPARASFARRRGAEVTLAAQESLHGWAVPVFPATDVQDTFSRANENPLAGGWSKLTGTFWSNMRLADNQLAPPSDTFGAGRGGSYLSGTSYTEDQEAFVTVAVPATANAGGSQYMDVWARVQNPGTDSVVGYVAAAVVYATGDGGTSDLGLWRYGGGSFTYLQVSAWELLSGGGNPWAAGDKFGIRCIGNRIELWLRRAAVGQWVLAAYAIDNTITGAGYIGTDGDSGSWRFDDFGGGGIPSFPVAPVLDDFNRADNTSSLGSSWGENIHDSTPSLGISSNQAYAASGFKSSYWLAQFASDQEVHVGLAVLPSSVVQVWARLQVLGSSNLTGYFINVDSTGAAWIEKYVAGAWSVVKAVVSNGTAVYSAGDKLGLRIVGSRLEAWRYRSGTAVLLDSATDTSITGAGYVGLYIGNETTARFDDFGASSLPLSPVLVIDGIEEAL